MDTQLHVDCRQAPKNAKYVLFGAPDQIELHLFPLSVAQDMHVPYRPPDMTVAVKDVLSIAFDLHQSCSQLKKDDQA